MTDQSRNLIIAVVLGIIIVFGSQYLFAPGRQQKPPPAEETLAGTPAETAPAPEAFVPVTREEALAPGQRIPIESPALQGSINLTGARIDDVQLRRYHLSPDPESPEITLLWPSGTRDAFFAEFGWLAQDAAVKLPDSSSVWQADGKRLTPEAPLTLTWDNEEGLRFSQTFNVDNDYLFTVTRRVENHGFGGVSLWPYGLISRVGEGDPIELKFSGYLVHIGAAGVIEGTLEEIDYDDLREDGRQSFETTGGWAGFTDKYWLVALAPDQAENVEVSFSATKRGETNKYQVDMRGSAQSLAPGEKIEVTEYLLAGAKKVTLFDDYEETYGISNLDGLVFKFLWFMAKPLFYALNFFHELWGNFGLAILSLTVCVRLLLFPLANKSYTAMSKMKQLGPQVTKLRERHKDDKSRLNQEMMALYKREKVNPMAGCLPILLQIPVFFALYSVLFVSIDMRHAPFFGWIRDLSAPDPYSVFNLFGLIPIDLPQFLMIGPWPLMMGFTMWLQFKLNPTPPEPIQAKIMMFLPIIFTFILASFPAGLVIYWTWNNCLSIAQQWIIMRRMGVKIGTGGKT